MNAISASSNYRGGLEVEIEPSRLEAVKEPERERYEAAISAANQMIDSAEADNRGPHYQSNLERLALELDSGVRISFCRSAPGEDFDLDILTGDENEDDLETVPSHGLPVDFSVADIPGDHSRFARSVLTGAAVDAFRALVEDLRHGRQDGVLIESAARYCFEAESGWFNNVTNMWLEETVYDEVRVTRSIRYAGGRCEEIVIDMELIRNVSNETDESSITLTGDTLVQMRRIRIVPKAGEKPALETGDTHYWQDNKGSVGVDAPYLNIVCAASEWGTRDPLIIHLRPGDWQKLAGRGAEDYGLYVPADEEDDYEAGDDDEGDEWDDDLEDDG